MLRIILIVLGVLFIILICVLGSQLRSQGESLLGFSFSTGETDLNIDLKDIMPDEWIPYHTPLIRVNLDDDDGEEWLLLYRYDLDQEKKNGQIGGVIYDAQNSPRGDDSIPLPEQSPAYLIPYRLLPDYHQPKITGYLGNDDVEYQQLAVNVKETDAEGNPVRHDRLMVRGQSRGKTNRFSIFWWISEEQGYGAAHAYTPGWFSLKEGEPYNWDDWKAGEYIQKLWAWEPQNDRSNLCRRALWKLSEESDPQFDRRFDAYYDGEIVFCLGTSPEEPAFPEAQVLAYLLDPKQDRWCNEPDCPLAQEATPEGERLAYDEVEVLHLTAPPVLDHPPEQPLVQVEADFNSKEGWQSTLWTLVMIEPATIKDAVKWRIVSVNPR